MTKVLVTGCFDILHHQHFNFLNQAKKSGEILLVGIETSQRVKSLKGTGRPINSLKTRIKNLKQLGIADQVFALPKKFNTSTDHLNLLKKIKPDILAISSHTPNQKAKADLMKKINGQLKIVFPHNPHTSTSKVIKNNP